MSDYEKVQWLQAACLLAAGMLFFMTLLYIAQHPVDEPEPVLRTRWHRKGKAEVMCPLHRIARSKCSPESHEEKP